MNPRHQRKTILKQIDQWERACCDKCRNGTPHAHNHNCGCRAAQEIQKLGKQYEAIAIEARKGRLDATVAELKRCGLTVDLYRSLREQGMFDKGILTITKMTYGELNEWKLENELVSEKILEQAKQRRQEMKEWSAVAVKNGITDMTFRKRVSKGESMESAASRPVEKKAGAKESAFRKREKESIDAEERAERNKWRHVAESNNIAYRTFRARVHENGWTLEQAATIPLGGEPRNPVWAEAQNKGIRYGTFKTRQKLGWSEWEIINIPVGMTKKKFYSKVGAK